MNGDGYTDDVERRLEDRFSKAPQPEPPSRLLDAIAADRAQPAAHRLAALRGRRGRAVPALAGLAATVVLALSLLTILSGRGAVSPGASASAATADGTVLTIETPKTHYAAGEAVQVQATVTYEGSQDVLDAGASGAGLVGFGVRQVGGSLDTGWGRTSDCRQYQLKRGEALVVPFAKSGGYLNDGSANDTFVKEYLSRPDLVLPAGRWQVYADLSYGGEGCSEPVQESTASVIVDVGTTAAPTPSPARTPAPSPTAALTLSLHPATVSPFGVEDETLGPVVDLGSTFLAFIRTPAGETVWSSTDGSRWTKVADPAAFGAADSIVPTVFAAVADGMGGVIAAGYTPLAEGGSVATIWRSSDGRTWRGATIDGQPGEDVATVAAHGGAFVAAGAKPRGGRLLYSEDGASWQVVSDLDVGSDSLVVFSWRDGFVLVGAGDGSARDIWTSPDGRTWTARPDWQTPAWFNGAIEVGGGLLAPVAVAGKVDEPVRTVWWWSSDGRTWQQTNGPALGLLGWGMAGDRLLVVSQAEGAPGASIEATADGRVWSPVGASDFRLEQGGSADVAATGSRVVVLGGLQAHSAWWGDLAWTGAG